MLPVERLRRSPQQQEVFVALMEKDARVAEWYDTAIRQMVIETMSPARLCGPAHLVRLILNEMPKFFQLPELMSLPSLISRVAKLQGPWNVACESPCRNENSWSGQIDVPIMNFLSECEQFFSIRAEPAKRNIATEALQRSDRALVAMPGNLIEKMAERWIALHKYFKDIAHGSSSGLDQFEDNLRDVERIVLLMLSPRPSESLAAIDAIFAEEQADA